MRDRPGPIIAKTEEIWKRAASIILLVAAFTFGAFRPAAAQRLSGTVLPQHYALRLTPNIPAATFNGDETIDVTLKQPTDAITLNAAEIHFGQVTAQVGAGGGAGQTLTARVTLDAAKEQATFHFAQTLPAGPATLRVMYSGILNNKLRGFYLSKTPQRNYAVTQFEPTDARRAFPSFDEPAMKATFNVTLVVAKGDTAISNTNIVSDTAGPAAGEHTIRFARTPKMSTYLVAFLVGDFKCLSGSSDGIPIRVCATPSRVQEGAFALSAAEFFLHYYDNYFGIKYPMPKLDLIGIPDFEAGAMENFGAITYRERVLLLDAKTAPLDTQKTVATDVAHEMAHQWFGDMVTMNWWDNIWLNEGFATWMQSKAVAAWKPEWNLPQQVVAEMDNTLNLDARSVTRAIQAKADTPAEINEMFDGITYYKAAGVLSMVENYLGAETFRRGIHTYLEAHMYGNATAQDFWNAQTAVSHRPVDKIMESLVTQPGEPLLTFSAVEGAKAQVRQQRFFLNPKTHAGAEQTWTVPVCMKTTGGADCQLLSGRSATLKAPAAPVFYGNAGGRGYYRSQYSPADYERLASHVETELTPEERISLLGSEWALTRAEKANIGDFLNLASAVKDDSNFYVVDTAASAISDMNQRIVSTPEEDRLLAEWVRKTFGPALARLGEPSASDSPARKELRAELFAIVGSIGGDPGVLTQAKQLADEYLQNPSSVDPTLSAIALEVAAQVGDEAFFDKLLRVSQTAANPQLRSQALYALTLFRNPLLTERALEYAVSGKVRNQDAALLIADAFRYRRTQDTAWRFLQAHWPQAHAQMTITTGEYVVEATGNFCSTERRSQVTAFFAQHPVAASAGSLKRAESQIGDCIELRSAQAGNLRQWLQAALHKQ